MCIYAESAPRSAAKFPIPLVVDIFRLSIRNSFSFEAVRKIPCGYHQYLPYRHPVVTIGIIMTSRTAVATLCFVALLVVGNADLLDGRELEGDYFQDVPEGSPTEERTGWGGGMMMGPKMCKYGYKHYVWVKSGDWHTGDKYYCKCMDGYWKYCKSVEKVAAVFDTNKLKGKIYTVQGHDKTASKWYAKFEHVDDCLCASGELNWHVHEKWSSKIGADSSLDKCGFEYTGNHYDPTYGCGPASQFVGDVCTWVRGGTQTCDLDKDVSTCEIGDLSGKLGKLELSTMPQSWHDPFATNILNYQGKGLVLHCCSDTGCGPRVACAVLNC